MKHYFISILFIFLSVAVFSQDVVKNSEYYLTKSKKQKTAAWLLLGGGTLSTTIGIAVGVAESTDAVLTAFSGEEVNEFSTGAVLMVVGLAAMAGSIPLFIASGKNKRKAASISLTYQRVRQLHNSGFVSKSFPSLTLTFNL